MFGRDVTADFERAARLEWLVTNGLGGYASGTIAGSAARRYHGLLIAAVRPPTDRIVTVSQLEESVRTTKGSAPLSSCQWPGVVDPRGHLNLEFFIRERRPTWRFRVDDLFLEKTLFMPQGQNTTLIEYRHVAGPACELTVRPFLVMRDHHTLTHENAVFRPAADAEGDTVRMKPYPELPALALSTSGGRFLSWPVWYKNFEYAFELERGLGFREDAMSPGTFVVEFGPGARWILALTTEDAPHAPPGGTALAAWTDAAWEAEEARLADVEAAPARMRGPAAESARAPEERLPAESLARLARAADQFWVEGSYGMSVIAGYPWFTDWGRDTMLSWPGLVLATGRLAAGRAALATFARFAKGGLLPNRFVEGGTGANAVPDYGSVDAALWFAVAAETCQRLERDDAFLASTLAPTLASVLDAFAQGTRFGIAARADGLLECGEAGTALTWMDARVDGHPVTPRIGLPVEVNALWYNAWITRAEFAARLGQAEEEERARAHAARIKSAFAETFWAPARGWLADRVDALGADPSLRPNQLYAVSLPHPVIEGAPARAVLEAVESRLLVPFGVRTLAPADAHYRGSYVGEPRVRDAGYHNGTAWPFLVGAWADAHFRVRGRSPQTRDHARRVLLPLVHHIEADGCIGQISEIFDGDLPQVPRGAFAQAWSVAELARVWIDEDL